MFIVYLRPRPGTTLLKSLPKSDTLFAAIATAGSLLGYNVERWFENTELRLSSVFPRDKENDIYFLPTPALLYTRKPENLEDYRALKRVRKKRWLPADLWLECVEKGSLDLLVEKESGANRRDFSLPSRPVPRNTVNRLLGRTEEGLYVFDEIFFAPGVELYFLLKVPSELEDEILASLRLLGDRGIGGDVSVGRGAFAIEASDEIPEQLNRVLNRTGSGKSITLSLYVPSNPERGEAFDDGALYSIVTRRGYVWASGVVKCPVLAVGEGSVLTLPPNRLSGDCPVVARGEVTGLGYDVKFWGRPFVVGG